LNKKNKSNHIFAFLLTFALSAVSPLSAFAQIVSVQQPQQQQPAPAPEPGPQVARVGVDESRPYTMTLFDAVKMALENNQEIEVERINVQQSEYDLFSATGARDVNLSGSTFFENSTVPVGSLLGGGPNGSLTTRSITYDLRAEQLLPTGGRWDAVFSNSRDTTNSQFAALSPQYATVASFEIRQPILRNFSIDDARRRIRIARRSLDLSDAQFRQRAIEVVARVQNAYWDLVFALRDVQIRREAVGLARTQLESNRRKVDEGTLAPIELVSVEVELERRNEDVLTAIDAVTRAENSLKQLILGDRQASLWAQPILPTDTPDTRSTNYTLNDAVRAAFTNRAEVASNNLRQEINKIEVKFFENQTRPQVDLVAGYTSNGLAGTALSQTNPFSATNALLLARVNQLSGLAGLPPVNTGPPLQLPGFLIGGYGQSLSNLFGNDFRTIRFGVSFNFPIRNRTAEGQLGRAIAEGRKIESQRRTLEQSIEAEVRNALQAVETGRQRVESARASREAAQKQSDSEQRRFQSGLSTTFLVLERQNDLSEAQGRELRALTDYNKALSELQRVMGTTLSASNVELTPAKDDKK
jgi:HAE1 family hydrophobic/amphiphilic exporter-1